MILMNVRVIRLFSLCPLSQSKQLEIQMYLFVYLTMYVWACIELLLLKTPRSFHMQERILVPVEVKSLDPSRPEKQP